ncbi:hypothetical protein EV363DRAFT_1403158 [Boletus edulis]|nr:hypothetical protein EV363DRAFT_1403190 [Boletus edulis]KAF8124597.1 hypothetical protein EV363DRAFT_1403158 [Boletus edulis]
MKNMGPGHRHDTLKDLIGDSNWKKVIGLGKSILQKITEAVPEWNDHQDDLWEFEKSLSECYSTQLSKWQANFEAWEKDRLLCQNPFKVKSHAYDVLEELCQALQARSYKLCFKDRFLHKQGANTQTRNSLKLVDTRISRIIGIITTPQQSTEDRPSKGQWRLSWIWITCGYGSGKKDREQDLQDAIWIEWCRAKAQADCWAEKVELLVEEQHCILQFFHWQSKWWMEKQGSIKTGDSMLNEVLNAYTL